MGRKWLEEKYLLGGKKVFGGEIFVRTLIGFHVKKVKSKRIFIPAKAENYFFLQNFQLIYFTSQINAHLISQQMRFCIISGILLVLPKLNGKIKPFRIPWPEVEC